MAPLGNQQNPSVVFFSRILFCTFRTMEGARTGRASWGSAFEHGQAVNYLLQEDNSITWVLSVLLLLSPRFPVSPPQEVTPHPIWGSRPEVGQSDSAPPCLSLLHHAQPNPRSSWRSPQNITTHPLPSFLPFMARPLLPSSHWAPMALLCHTQVTRALK